MLCVYPTAGGQVPDCGHVMVSMHDHAPCSPCVYMCLLTCVQEGKYLTVGKSERAKDSGQQLLADMAIQTNAR